MEAIDWSKTSLNDLADKIVEKFGPCYGGFPWAWYDGIADPCPEEVTLADCALSICMGSRFRQDNQVRDWDTLKYKLKPTIDSLLRTFDTTISLYQDTPQVKQFLADFHKLLDLLPTASGWGVAKLTKVLHRKRPSLIPMLDSKVQNAYLFGPRSKGLWPREYPREYMDKAENIERAKQVVDHFREELRAHLKELQEIARTAHSKAPSIVSPSISPVRCLEALVFWLNTKRTN